MSAFFNEIFYKPLFNALIFLYQSVTFGDLGLAIILLTIIVRFLLYPLFHKSAKNQRIMQMLQPQIKKIQAEHKDNKEKQATALLEVYREHRVNPFSGFFLLLVQIPVLIALYHVFLSGLADGAFSSLYSFITKPEALNFDFLGLVNLHERSIVIVGLAVAAQYVQGKLSLPAADPGSDLSPQERMAKQMVFIGPVLALIVLMKMPAAIGLYWLTGTVFSVFQQIIVNKSLGSFPKASRPDAVKSEV